MMSLDIKELLKQPFVEESVLYHKKKKRIPAQHLKTKMFVLTFFIDKK